MKARTPHPVAYGLRVHRLSGDANIAAPAQLIGDEARAAMLLALGSGRPLSASQLAAAARVRPQTASSHLTKLVAGGLLRVECSGRFRYYRIAGPDEIGPVIGQEGAPGA
ncbi:MAG: helix-turn-helix transcriptional regulator [Candidatus Eremiobacteraeota bacterium]|nr:helix-turn-helix transcriptional regulator [Candidatus Eremiobacteraeota bacterium]MBC5801623.1 helix-turn-helix transcriptional regulator [Candidatus Eremiobacteraeota bacterium]MBC5821308.1 helix-turn-helix transcriptional regulator [Candidatus Eremiobacteraeota bacterium]